MVLIFKTILLVLVAVLFVVIYAIQKEIKNTEYFAEIIEDFKIFIILMRSWQIVAVSWIVLILCILLFVK